MRDSATEQPVLLIGAGAVGSLLCASLLRSGAAVQWLVRNPQRRSVAAQLQLICDGETLELPRERLRIIGDIGEAQPTAACIVAVKAQQVEQVVTSVGAGLVPARNGKGASGPVQDRPLLVVANGLVDGDFHLGLLYGGAYVDGSSVVTSGGNRLRAGTLGCAPGRIEPLLQQLAAPWLSCIAVDDIEPLQWHKLALNCAVNPLTAVLDCENGRLAGLSHRRLMGGVLAEIEALARRRFAGRWSYDVAQLAAACESLIAATPLNSSSMREDLRLGRETEIELMNLAVARLGAASGLPCPLNAALGRMLSLLTNRGGL